MSNAITFRMPFAVPGEITRGSQATIEPQPYGATAFLSYGVPVAFVSGLIVPITGVGVATYGILVRPFPTQGPNASDPLNVALPPTSGVANVLRRGYIGVFVQNFAVNPAVVGAAVNVWYSASSGNHVQGGIEAAASGGNTYALNAFPYNAYFSSASDANGFAEITFNI